MLGECEWRSWVSGGKGDGGHSDTENWLMVVLKPASFDPILPPLWGELVGVHLVAGRYEISPLATTYNLSPSPI
jgi:hypothetical protein